MDSMDSSIQRRHFNANHLLRRSGSSGSRCGPNPCEKPTSSSTFTLPIILGVAVPLFGAAILFLILQRRHTRKIREEDADDRHASLDFGLGDTSNLKSSKKSSIQSMKNEKTGLSRRQVSLNMSMNNPYLLSLDSKNSKESLDSLSISLRKEDPYRPVSQFLASDTASTRPQTRSGSSANNLTNNSQIGLQDNRDSSNASVNPKVRSTNEAVFPPRYNSLPYPRVNINDQAFPSQNGFPTELPQAHILPEPKIATNGWASGRPLNQQLQNQLVIGHENINSFENNQNFRTNDHQNVNQNHAYESTSYYEEERAEYMNNPLNLRNPAGGQVHAAKNINYELNRGDPASTSYADDAEYMYENHYAREDQARGVDMSYNINRMNNRLSVMQVRPLPPNSVTDSDDPEIRANRIRSFYKEYFDDSSSIPNVTYEMRNNTNHNEESIFYDTDSNQFVLPYNQPVTRRALTPPPANTLMKQARPRNGSMGTMNYVENQSRYHPAEAVPPSSTPGSQQVNLQKPTLPFLEIDQIPVPGNIRNDASNMRSHGYVPPMVYRGHNGISPEGHFPERQRTPKSNPLSFETSPIPSPHLLEKGAYSSLNFAPPKKFREMENNSDARSVRSNNSAKAGVNTGMPQNSSNRIDHLPEDVVFSKDCLNSSLKPQWNMSR